jgi:hypothetical protein
VIGAFTLAHTVTLALAALDVVRVPSSVVEPLIAASIAVVAARNLLRPQRDPGRERVAVAFLFGLVHGLGVAGGLRDAMAGMSVVFATLAIVAFSAGVQTGHQLVVIPAYLALHLLRRRSCPTSPSEPRVTPAYAPDRRVRWYGSALISAAAYFISSPLCAGKFRSSAVQR